MTRQSSPWLRIPPSGWLLTSPNLVDVYLDTRPNDRVRAFVLGRAQVNVKTKYALYEELEPAAETGMSTTIFVPVPRRRPHHPKP